MYIEKITHRNKGIKRELTKDPDGIFTAYLERLKGLKHISLNNFYANANSLNIIPVDSAEDMPDKTMYAAYDVGSNTLKYLKAMYQNAIDHELLHLSSTVFEKDYVHCGFCQIDLKHNIAFAEALNEGYTAVLDDRYFGDRTETKKEIFDHTYMLPKFFAENLESIIGKTLMEKLYFDGDIEGLINEMCKYISYNRVIDFIFDMDMINDGAIYDTELKSYKNIVRAFEDAVSIIIEMLLYDLYYSYYSGDIDIQELANKAQSIKKYSLMVVSLTSLTNGKNATTKPMSEKQFTKLAEKCSNSAKKNI